MITTLIQIFAILLLGFVLLRVNKQDRLAELRKREELQDLFREQEKTFHTKLGSVTSSIKVQAELTYAEQHARLVESMKILSGMVGQNTSELAQYKQMVQASRKCVSDNNVMLSQIRTIITDVNHATNIIHQELQIISKPLTNLIETKKQNLIKDGEANRTLRRRLQESAITLNSVKANLRNKEALVSELKDQIQKLSALETQLTALEKDKAYHEAAADLLAEELTHFQTQTRAQLASLHMPAEEIERIFSSINQNVQKLMNPTATLDAACQ